MNVSVFLLVSLVSSQANVVTDPHLTTIMKCSKNRTATGGQLAKTTNFSSEDYDKIYEAIEKVYKDLSEQCDGTKCDRVDFAGCTVRLAAHDFLDTTRGTELAQIANVATENPRTKVRPVLPFSTDVNREMLTKLVGGSDGCVLMDRPANAGLAQCVSESKLPQLYEEFCDKINLPDFIVLAAESVMSLQATCPETTKNAFQYNFKYGREWCGSTGHEHAVGKAMEAVSAQPSAGAQSAGAWGGGVTFTLTLSPNLNTTIESRPVEAFEKLVTSQLFYDTSNVFKQAKLSDYDEKTKTCNKTLKKIGNLTEDVILGSALLGAHTIGRTNNAASGYNGFWSDPKSSMIFNNGFYKDLLYKGYEPQVITAIPAGCPKLTTDDKCLTSRCRISAPFCEIGTGICTDKRAALQSNLRSLFHYDNPLCNQGRTNWNRTDERREKDEKDIGKFDEAMLNTDIILVHNFEQLSNAATCCAFFEESFLIEKGLGHDKELFCGSGDKCCDKHKQSCSDLKVESEFDFSKFETLSEVQALTQSTFLDQTSELPFYSYVHTGTSENGGIALDAIIEFAKNEETFLEYFHKSWYLATTGGKLGLQRINGKAPSNNVECFSWGCEGFSSEASYYNEGYTNKLDEVFNISECESDFTAVPFCKSGGSENGSNNSGNNNSGNNNSGNNNSGNNKSGNNNSGNNNNNNDSDNNNTDDIASELPVMFFNNTNITSIVSFIYGI